MDKGTLFIICSFIFAIEVLPSNQDENLESLYLLPRYIFPSFYDVILYLDPNSKENFYGKVSIRIIPYRNTDEVVLHAEGINITFVQVYNERYPDEDLFSEFTLATDDTHKLKIKLIRQIGTLQPHILNIDYIGTFHDLFGIYKSSYEYSNGDTRHLIASQFSPTYARRALPCFDEPLMKAIFRNTIYAPKNYSTVLSNMPERMELLKEDIEGFLKYEFEDTPIMSTYILAFFVSDFDYIDNLEDPIFRVPFKIYTKPDTLKKAYYSLNFGQKNMIILENYTSFPYALPKLDNVAMTDFGFGAMENWGLTLYRQERFLVEEGVTTTAQKFSVSTIIGHENAHLWFGNEVSPISWTFTWLKEGFASFFENYASEMVNSEYRFMDWSVIQMQRIFLEDAQSNALPMNQEVYTPSQILNKFNFVSYRKAASIIRMMHHFITAEVFQEGLRKYIGNNAKHAVSPMVLYAALQEALNESDHTIPYTIAVVLDAWASQPGFPLLNVRRTAPSANSIFVSQTRFLNNGSLSSSERWIVPINWVLSTNPNFSDTRAQSWISTSYPAPSVNIPDLTEAQWFIINIQQTGYYRVNYDETNWRALAAALYNSHENIHVLNRAQLIDDSFNVARIGQLNYATALEILRYLTQEEDFIPWSSAEQVFEYVLNMLQYTDSFELFQKHVKHLASPLYKKLGFQASSNEEYGTIRLRTIILNINCNNGNSDCLETTNHMLQKLKLNPSQRLDPDIKEIVYCSSLRGGDSDNYDFLWEQLISTTDQTERNILIRALGCTSNSTLRDRYLNQSLDDYLPLRDSERTLVFQSTISASTESMEATWQFFSENFSIIKQRFPLISTATILNSFSQRLTSSTQLQFERFVESYSSDFSSEDWDAIDGVRHHLVDSQNWVNNYLHVFDSWLSDNFENHAERTKINLLLVLVIFVVTEYN